MSSSDAEIPEKKKNTLRLLSSCYIPWHQKPYSRVRPCFVDICLPTVDIMGISEQPEKHGGTTAGN